MTQAELNALVNALIIDNNTNQVTPAKVRSVFLAVIDSIQQTNLAEVTANAPLNYDAFNNLFTILQADTDTNGFLSADDWNMFDEKQDLLVSGTNIKTINGESILGSGNISISNGVTLTKKTITSANLTTQDVAGFLVYVNGVTSFAIATNEIVEYLVTDTGQVFMLMVNNRSVGSGETALTSADVLLLFEDLTIAEKSWSSWMASGIGTTAINLINGNALVITGTASTVSYALDTPKASIPFVRATGSSGAGVSCGWKETSNFNTSLIQGFDYVFIYSPGDNTASSRGFVGLYGTTAVIPNLDPSTFLFYNVGLGHDTSDTNLQIMHNDSSGTSTKVPLGADFPANDTTKVYLLRLRCEPVTTPVNAVINWKVVELVNKKIATGVITTNLPHNISTLASSMTHTIWRNTGSNVTVPIIDFSKIFLKRLR